MSTSQPEAAQTVLPAAERPIAADLGLLLARLVPAASLLLAATFKIKGDPYAFSLAIDSFKLFPQFTHLPMAYFVPMFELVLGITLVLGIWTRQSAALTAVLFIAFTLALASVLLRGLDVDCGCFGDFFGGNTVTWFSILRNLCFIIPTLIVTWFGAGRFAIMREK